MSTTTYTNPDGSKSTIVIPDPVVTPAVVTVGDADYSWTPAPAVKPVVRTLVGNTPRDKSDAPGVAVVDKIYGAAQVMRLYCDGPLLLPAVTDRKVVGSFKTLTSTATMKAAAVGYDWLFEQHEADAKWMKAAAGLSGADAVAARAAWLHQWQADMATLDTVDIPHLGVCLTADCFVNPSKNPGDFLIPSVPHLGVDFDGISPKPTSTAYHDYTAELAALLKFLKAHPEITSWGVPEFGANRGAFDTDGSARAAWLVYWVKAFRDAGAQYVCLWEQTSQAGSCFTTPVEVATLRTMFALAG